MLQQYASILEYPIDGGEFFRHGLMIHNADDGTTIDFYSATADTGSKWILFFIYSLLFGPLLIRFLLTKETEGITCVRISMYTTNM